MFESLGDRLQGVFKELRGEGHLTGYHLDTALRQIRLSLLEADVALPVVRQFTARVKEEAVGKRVLTQLSPAQEVTRIVRDQLVALLGGEKADIDLGWDIAQKIAALDIGQTIIVKNGAVLAIEGFDGTNETMRRGGALGRGGAVMIKVAKPNQDMRFDVPVIGPETISVAAEAKIRVIALEASRTLLLEKEDVIRAAQSAKISMLGR